MVSTCRWRARGVRVACTLIERGRDVRVASSIEGTRTAAFDACLCLCEIVCVQLSCERCARIVVCWSALAAVCHSTALCAGVSGQQCTVVRLKEVCGIWDARRAAWPYPGVWRRFHGEPTQSNKSRSAQPMQALTKRSTSAHRRAYMPHAMSADVAELMVLHCASCGCLFHIHFMSN